MPTTKAEATVAEPAAGVTCAVCPHRWNAHDSIGVRYCSATAAHGLHRGCVCVDSAAATPPQSTFRYGRGGPGS